MDHLFIGLVLCSALLHAIWNAFLHVSEDRLVQLGTMSLPYFVFGVAGAAQDDEGDYPASLAAMVGGASGNLKKTPKYVVAADYDASDGSVSTDCSAV